MKPRASSPSRASLRVRREAAEAGEAAEVARQEDRDHGAVALLAVDQDAAVVGGDHALGDGEPDAGAGLLGREAGHEDPAELGARDAGAGVLDDDLDRAAAARDH